MKSRSGSGRALTWDGEVEREYRRPRSWMSIFDYLKNLEDYMDYRVDKDSHWLKARRDLAQCLDLFYRLRNAYRRFDEAEKEGGKRRDPLP